MKNFNTIRRRVALGAVMLFGGSLAITGSGCGGSGDSDKGPRVLTFDDLGGGSPKIHVYPGTGHENEDRDSNAFYLDDEQVLAKCWEKGRLVLPRPELGELSRSSDKWFQIDAEPTQYATAVYVKDPQTLLKQLPEC